MGNLGQDRQFIAYQSGFSAEKPEFWEMSHPVHNEYT